MFFGWQPPARPVASLHLSLQFIHWLFLLLPSLSLSLSAVGITTRPSIVNFSPDRVPLPKSRNIFCPFFLCLFFGAHSWRKKGDFFSLARYLRNDVLSLFFLFFNPGCGRSNSFFFLQSRLLHLSLWGLSPTPLPQKSTGVNDPSLTTTTTYPLNIYTSLLFSFFLSPLASGSKTWAWIILVLVVLRPS